MQDKNNKELIEAIKEQLKAFESTPYKKGAWESYQATYGTGSKVRKFTGLYWSAAAAIVLIGFAGMSHFQNKQVPTDSNGSFAQQQQQQQHNLADGATQDSQLSTAEVPSYTMPVESPASHSATSLVEGLAQSFSNLVKPSRADLIELERIHAIALAPLNNLLMRDNSLRSINLASPKLASHEKTFFYGANSETTEVELGMGYTAAQQQAGLDNVKGNQALNLSPKSYKLMDKLAIGAFLSPSKSDNKIDLGGGLLFAYQFTDKLAIRTGAAFNQYEVGILPNKLSASKNIQNLPSDSPVASDMPYRVTASLPNINAITGKVQTLDIPLEMEYKLTKSFYTSLGVSYAAVLSQERYNHYQELSDPLMFSVSSDTGKPTNAEVKVVDKKIASNEGNVETSGFGGFINLSVGRKTNLSKNLKLSVEPYVKFPVGQFKRADMNYTNGGIKIITNF